MIVFLANDAIDVLGRVVFFRLRRPRSRSVSRRRLVARETFFFRSKPEIIPQF